MSRCASQTIIGFAVALGVAVVSAQSSTIWVSRDHPAIQYSSRPPRDPIVQLNESIAKGKVTLAFDAMPRGYLASVLKALDIPSSSQTLVFSENSLQRAHISKATPRAIYFNDTVAVAWAKGAETIEATALDATQGVHFYSIPQTPRSEAAVHSPQCRLSAVPPAAADPRRAGRADDERAAAFG